MLLDLPPLKRRSDDALVVFTILRDSGSAPTLREEMPLLALMMAAIDNKTNR
jgi:hypothetical protein